MAVLRVAAGPLERSTGFDWFHTACAILGLAAVVGGIGAAVGSRVATVAAPWERGPAARLLLGLCLGTFGVVVFAVGLSVGSSHPARDADLTTSSIWAGYSTSAGGAARVTATWTQPRVRARGPGWNAVGFWVGLEGQQSDTVEQIGTEGYCQSGTLTQYDAWYENYPQPAVSTGLSIDSGDTVTATVVSLGHDRFRLTMVNDTTGARFATTQIAGGVGNMGAAIMVEAPHERGRTLAGFDPVRFRRCALDGQPIDAFALIPSEIVTTGGVYETDTSALGADGASFSVTRR